MTLKPFNLLKVLVLGLVLTYAQAFYGQSVDFTLSKNSQDRVSKEKKKSDILGLTFKMNFENAVTLAESKNVLFTIDDIKISNGDVGQNIIDDINALFKPGASNRKLLDDKKTLVFSFPYTSSLAKILEEESQFSISYTIEDKAAKGYQLLANNNTYSSTLGFTEEEESVDENEVVFSPLEIQKAANDYFVKKKKSKLNYDQRRNIYTTKKSGEKEVIHIFIDENGNLIKTGVPTTATKKYKYQLHLLIEENSLSKYEFKFTSDGEFEPQFNILDTSDTELNFDDGNDKPKIIEIEYAIIGPFTDKFDIKLVKNTIGEENSEVTLIEEEVKIAKSYQVSLSTGIFSSTLKSPENIQKMALASGDSTLVADNPNSRGAITLMATFYPRERSFQFAPDANTPFMERIGIQVGTQVNDKLTENFFLGLSYDITWGSSISVGVHYGRRNYIAGKEDFDFGTEVFDLPELIIKKEWQAGFYFGVVIDTRVAFKLISNLAGNND